MLLEIVWHYIADRHNFLLKNLGNRSCLNGVVISSQHCPSSTILGQCSVFIPAEDIRKPGIG